MSEEKTATKTTGSEPIMPKLNFVDHSDRDLLLFVQSSIREKNILEKELEEKKSIYDDVELKAKAKLMDLEEVKSLGTGKEREAKVKSMLKDEIPDNYQLEISLFENKMDDIKNELDLAREIYRLKNI